MTPGAHTDIDADTLPARMAWNTPMAAPSAFSGMYLPALPDPLLLCFSDQLSSTGTSSACWMSAAAHFSSRTQFTM